MVSPPHNLETSRWATSSSPFVLDKHLTSKRIDAQEITLA